MSKLFLKIVITSMSGLLLMAAASGDGVSRTKHPGEALYKKYQCISCHGSNGTRPFNLTDSELAYTYDSLKKYIDNPAAYGNARMPAFRGEISEKEYKDLIAYVMVLRDNAEGRK